MSQLPPLPDHPLIYSNILDLVCDTPMVELDPDRVAAPRPRAKIWGKLESANPGGSVKDRICLAMIRHAEACGKLKPGGLVVEPTSGNTGIGLALVCARLGYRCTLTMPESMSLERRALLRNMGAKVVLTPSEEQMEGAIRKATEIAEAEGGFIPKQFSNGANPQVHEETTAAEILHCFEDCTLDAFVAGIGTGGTLTGVGRALRRELPACRLVGVEPESCATLSRGEVGPTKIQGWAPGFVPANFDPEVPTELRTVTDRAAYDMKQCLAKTGVLVGISAGGAVSIALDIARELGPNANVAVILPDTGERYFSLDEHFSE